MQQEVGVGCSGAWQCRKHSVAAHLVVCDDAGSRARAGRQIAAGFERGQRRGQPAGVYRRLSWPPFPGLLIRCIPLSVN